MCSFALLAMNKTLKIPMNFKFHDINLIYSQLPHPQTSPKYITDLRYKTIRNGLFCFRQLGGCYKARKKWLVNIKKTLLVKKNINNTYFM